jgi:kynurenine formamidase
MALALTAAVGADEPQFVDLSLLVAEDYPCTWPAGFPLFQIRHYQRIGPESAYNSDILTIDGNTGTQIDVPPHSIPSPATGLPGAAPLGDLFTDKVAAWQFVGEACVVDFGELLDSAPNGTSSLVQKEHIVAWEEEYRPLRFGDVVLLKSGYSDRYYRPLPEGRRFIAEPVEGKAPAWPDPHPDCMEYLASRGVKAVGTDSPSIGPLPDLAEPTHLAGLKHGMIFTEGLTGLDKLPPTGAFYCVLGPRHAEGPYGEGRALAILPGPLAERLIASARKKQAIELSVVMSKDLPLTWTGRGTGNHRHPYLKADFLYSPTLGLYHHTHMFDSHAGTHLVPPAYALPAERFDNAELAPELREWLAEYESQYGPRGTSSMTTEQVPLDWPCGRARVIDLRRLIGTTSEADWPASPEITPDDIRAYESDHGPLEAGDVVIFRTEHTDKFFRPMPEGKACIADPVNGKSEGWPTPGPDAIVYLAEKGIRALAIDAPSLGGVEPRRALMTYWALGSKQMVGVEFLTSVGALPPDAWFLFAPVKIQGCHGGPGRAIAVY